MIISARHHKMDCILRQNFFLKATPWGEGPPCFCESYVLFDVDYHGLLKPPPRAGYIKLKRNLIKRRAEDESLSSADTRKIRIRSDFCVKDATVFR